MIPSLRTAAIAAVFAFAIGPPAIAGETPPPEKGWFGSFTLPTVICDTADQISAIAEAARARPDCGTEAKFGELNAARNSVGEPACIVGHVDHVGAGESIDVGIFPFAADKWAHGWAVHIGTARGAWWLLYMQPVAPPAGLAVPPGAPGERVTADL